MLSPQKENFTIASSISTILHPRSGSVSGFLQYPYLQLWHPLACGYPLHRESISKAFAASPRTWLLSDSISSFMLSFLLPLMRTIRPDQRYLNQATVPFTAMEAAAQKKSNSRRWAAILDYER